MQFSKEFSFPVQRTSSSQLGPRPSPNAARLGAAVAADKFNIRHTTCASLMSHHQSQTVPQTPPTLISTRPWFGAPPSAKRTIGSEELKKKVIIRIIRMKKSAGVRSPHKIQFLLGVTPQLPWGNSYPGCSHKARNCRVFPLFLWLSLLFQGNQGVSQSSKCFPLSPRSCLPNNLNQSPYNNLDPSQYD